MNPSRDEAAEAPCKKCGQVDHGQYGEYPCPECGLPTMWDKPAPAAPSDAEVEALELLFTQPPGPNSEFVEAEVGGAGVRCGTWIQRGPYSVLRITRADFNRCVPAQAAPRDIAAIQRHADDLLTSAEDINASDKQREDCAALGAALRSLLAQRKQTQDDLRNEERWRKSHAARISQLLKIAASLREDGPEQPNKRALARNEQAHSLAPAGETTAETVGQQPGGVPALSPAQRARSSSLEKLGERTLEFLQERATFSCEHDWNTQNQDDLDALWRKAETLSLLPRAQEEEAGS